jgi:GNAT superfamily N-acetyltransferase
MYRIIQAKTESQLASVKRLDKAIFSEDERVKIEGGVWWLIYHKGEAVGFGGLAVIKDLNYGFFRRAGVLYDHRGHGLQKKLIKIRLRYLKKLRIPCAITYTVLDNPASSNSLISMGFKLYTPSEPYCGSNVLYFKKASKYK